MESPRVRHIVGCMTGTSLDGLDCALTRITGEGLDMSAEFLGLVSLPFDESFRAQLLHLAEGNAAPPIDYLRAARMLGVLHAQGVERLLRENGFADPSRWEGAKRGIDFVVAHGQTIWHAPQDTLSWQLFDPWPIVRHLGVPVCYDLRQADLIAGGEGAPITPIADPVLYKTYYDGTVLNLGGICNFTSWVSPDWQELHAHDLCPCNLLIDGIVRRLFPGVRFDQDGRIAASAKPERGLVDAMAEAIDRRTSADRTMGREQFNDVFIDEIMQLSGSHAAEAVVSSATQVIAERIGLITRHEILTEIILAGGGARNRVLVERIREQSCRKANVKLSDAWGIPCEAREAMGFAVLGALSQDKVPITLPQVTGAKAPGVAGSWAYA